MAKKVLISGYIGFSNFGDDVIFAMLIRHLKAKGFEISALSANPQRTKKQFKVGSAHYKNPFDIISEILKCDYLISGGGSLLQNTTSNLSLLYYIFIILLAKLMFKKVIIFAQGIGPVNGWFWRNLTRFTLTCCNLITVRDKESYKQLGKWKIKSSLVNDPAWDIPTLPIDNKGYVGVQLRQYSNMHPDFVKLLVKYIGMYFSERKIILFVFQKPDDLVIAKEFERELRRQYPEIKYEINFESTIKSIVQGFSNLEYLFAMRFHACLLGLKYGLKVFALPYDIKVENLANEYRLVNIMVGKKPENYNAFFSTFMQRENDPNMHKPTFNWSIVDKYMAK